MTQPARPTPFYSVYPIGYVQTCEEVGRYEIEILPAFREALEQLDQFSHVMILWWADRCSQPADRNVLSAPLPYAPGVRAGVFACRSQYRPNPIAVTTMPILQIDLERGKITLPWIDALDGTPVLDLKPYLPVSDRVRDVRVAGWMQAWPEWMEEAGAFFAQNETQFDM